MTSKTLLSLFTRLIRTTGRSGVITRGIYEEISNRLRDAPIAGVVFRSWPKLLGAEAEGFPIFHRPISSVADHIDEGLAEYENNFICTVGEHEVASRVQIIRWVAASLPV